MSITLLTRYSKVISHVGESLLIVMLAVAKLEELVDKVNDIVDQQLTKHLHTIANALLVSLGSAADANGATDATAGDHDDEEVTQFSLEDFVSSNKTATRGKSMVCC